MSSNKKQQAGYLDQHHRTLQNPQDMENQWTLTSAGKQHYFSKLDYG